GDIEISGGGVTDATVSVEGIVTEFVNICGEEDFENSNLTASYANGNFTNNGITWTYVHARNHDTFPINGNGIILRRSDEPSSITAEFSGGIGNFSVDTRKAYTGNAQRKLELVING